MRTICLVSVGQKCKVTCSFSHFLFYFLLTSREINGLCYSTLFLFFQFYLQGGKGDVPSALRSLNLDDFIESKAKVINEFGY